jgi:hypothetical protein
VVLALRPSTPAPREQRPPKRDNAPRQQTREAHGIPAGPVFRLSGTARGVASARGELREDGAVGVKPDPFKTTDAKRR